jgi:hypothetical protein
MSVLNRFRKRNDESMEVPIISYPKTGRTWLRALIGRCLTARLNLPENRTLDTADLTEAAGLLRTGFIHDGSALKENRSYLELDPDKSGYSGKKVVLLSRDVKDTLVSAYFQATRRIKVFDGPISDFIRSDLYGVMKILTFYRIWIENRDVPQDLLFVTYENLSGDPRAVLEKVLGFIGAVEPGMFELEEAVEYCSFDNLKRAEEENRFESNLLRPRRRGDADSFKVRKGKIGNYREYLSREDIEYVDAMIREHGCPYTDFPVKEDQ